MPKEPAELAKAKPKKPRKPTTPPSSEPEEEGPSSSVFSRYRRYCIPVRYVENCFQDHEKIFVEKYEKDGGSIKDLLKLYDLAYRFGFTKDHTILPDLLTLAHRLKVYPPLSVLGHVARALQESLESKGRKSLDTCLGIRVKPGSRSLLTQQKEKTRDQHYVRVIRIWTMVHGLRLEDACMIAADQYKGPQKLPRETIEQRWRSKEWKAYRSTLDENDLSGIKKRHPSSKGKRLIPARLLMPIALCLIATERFPERKHKKDLKRRCMGNIKRNMQVAHLVPEISDYLPRIQKVLKNKKAYPGVSKQRDAIKSIIREALEDPKNPFEFSKNTPSEKAFLLKHLSP